MKSSDRTSEPTRRRRDRGGRDAPAAGVAAARRPPWRFLGVFLGLMALFFLLMQWSFVRETLFPAYLRVNAAAGTWVINLFGGEARVEGPTISSGSFAIEIRKGCDALEPMALLVAGVLASPVVWRRKVPGVMLGIAFLLVCNLIRIATLFYFGVHHPRLFQTVHLDVWQALFVFLAVGYWIAWALWAARPRREPVHEPS